MPASCRLVACTFVPRWRERRTLAQRKRIPKVASPAAHRQANFGETKEAFRDADTDGLRRPLPIGLTQVPLAVVLAHGVHHCRVIAVSGSDAPSRAGSTDLENNLRENQRGGNARRAEIQNCVHAMRSGNASSRSLQKIFSISAAGRNACRCNGAT